MHYAISERFFTALYRHFDGKVDPFHDLVFWFGELWRPYRLRATDHPVFGRVLPEYLTAIKVYRRNGNIDSARTVARYIREIVLGIPC